MKKATRFLSMLLTLCMLLGLIPTAAFAANSQMPFADVDSTDWFYDSVQYAYENGMMSGTGEDTFSPNATTTRGMIVTILHSLEGKPAESGKTFTDVAQGQYYAAAVAWASANGIVSGYDDGRFGPNDPITREQLAAILFGYAKYKGYDVSVGEDTNILSYADASKISQYAIPAMQWAIGLGLISGVTEDTLDPAGNATRAQAATVLTQFCRKMGVTGPACTVTFQYNYDEKGIYKTLTVDNGETVDCPAKPSRSGYTFSGWYTQAEGGEKFDFDTPVTRDLTLYARWEASGGGGGGGGGGGSVPAPVEEYPVTFLRNDGTAGAYKMEIVKENQTVAKPADPTREQYEFGGWYTEADLINEYDFSAPVTQELFLYASWTAPAGSDEEEEGQEDQENLYGASSGGGTTDAIAGIVMENGQVEVTVSANETRALTVSFLDEENKQVLTTVSAQTPQYCELVPVSIPVDEQLPQYYVIKAVLLDGEGDEVCDPYTCIKYTAAYEEFDQQTASDLEAEGRNVVNFDSQDDNNFGVLAKGIVEVADLVRLEEQDDEITAYVFDDPSKEVKDLKAGDRVMAEAADGQIHLFKVGAIEMKDGAAYITPDENVALSDFYELLKVNMDADTQTGEPDGGDGPVLFSIEDIHVDETIKKSLGGEFNKELSQHGRIQGEVSGTGELDIEIIYDAIIFGEDYFYCSVINELELEVSVDLELFADNGPEGTDLWKDDDEEFKLPKISVPTPIPGLTAYFKVTIPMEWEVQGGLNFDFTSSTESGFIYDSNSGEQKIDRKDRTVEFGLKGEAEISFGPKVAAGVAFCDSVLKGQVAVHAGVEAKASTELGFGVTDGECKHACTLCLDGECKWFAELSIEFSYKVVKNVIDGKVEWVPIRVEGWINFIQLSPGQFYLSIINSEDSLFGGRLHFGGGDCPNVAWRTKLATENRNGETIQDNEVTLRKKQNLELVTTVDTPAAAYLYDGFYTAECYIGGQAVKKSFSVNGAAQSITLTAQSADGKMEGKVCNTEGRPITGATVIISQGGMDVARIAVNMSGEYYTSSLAEGTYRVEITADGYIPCVSYETVRNGETTQIETTMMVAGEEQYMGGLSGTITDATTGQPVEGVEVAIRAGWNSGMDGQVIRRLTTNEDGFFLYDTVNVFGVVFGLESGNYTLTISKDGYTTTSFNAVVRPGEVTGGQDATISPTMTGEGQYRVVLRWGEHPWDLDSHFNGLTDSGARDHICYYNQDGYTGNLDVDDVTSYGPETVTVTDFDGLKNGFTYSVHDYTNLEKTSSTALANSGAKVELYQGDALLRTYFVPTGRGGTVWNVFSIDGDGRITSLNTFEYISDPENVGISFAPGATSGYYSEVQTVSLLSEAPDYMKK